MYGLRSKVLSKIFNDFNHTLIFVAREAPRLLAELSLLLAARRAGFNVRLSAKYMKHLWITSFLDLGGIPGNIFSGAFMHAESPHYYFKNAILLFYTLKTSS